MACAIAITSPRRCCRANARRAGSIGRVPAAEIEALVIAALRNHLQASGAEPQPTADNDRDLIERHVERITLTPKHIKLQMRPSSDAAHAVTVRGGRRSQRDRGFARGDHRHPLDRPRAGGASRASSMSRLTIRR